MRLEQFPIVLGILVALIGLSMALDAWQVGGIAPFKEHVYATPIKVGHLVGEDEHA